MKNFFIKILLLTSVFYFSDIYCMKKFLKKYICCCCCFYCDDKNDDAEFMQEDSKDFVEALRTLTPEEIDREIEDFAQQVKEQSKPGMEKLKKFFEKKRSSLKKLFAKYKKNK